MTRSRAFKYILISIAAIALGSFLLISIWQIAGSNPFLAALALISIFAGSGVFSIALTRIVLKPEVVFGIGDLSTRAARDLFRQRVGRKTARKVSWISDILFILTLLIVVYISSLVMKKFNLG